MSSIPQTPLPEPDDPALLSALESILLVAGGPVAVSTLATALGESEARIAALLLDLRASLHGGIRLQVLAGEAQLVTAPENVEAVQRYLGVAKPPALSRSTLEALTVIAYRQPVTRSEIEASRGVNSDRAVHTLLARELIEERGPRDTLGRPMQYGTSFGFLEYFGLESLDQLPPLSKARDIELPAGGIGLRAFKNAPHE